MHEHHQQKVEAPIKQKQPAYFKPNKRLYSRRKTMIDKDNGKPLEILFDFDTNQKKQKNSYLLSKLLL